MGGNRAENVHIFVGKLEMSISEEQLWLKGFADNAREIMLRSFGHVQRTDSEYNGENMLKIKLPDRRFVDSVKEDVQRLGVTEETGITIFFPLLSLVTF